MGGCVSSTENERPPPLRKNDKFLPRMSCKQGNEQTQKTPVGKEGRSREGNIQVTSTELWSKEPMPCPVLQPEWTQDDQDAEQIQAATEYDNAMQTTENIEAIIRRNSFDIRKSSTVRVV
ncbi:hypothetical protein Y032_0015g2642 [Ancylostoma ceylanicum]|uniref:Uncharacterized protein n=2 Tax=Ancylostoma ceylanicum TaxID=53326 RepID=A0A016V6Y3_9BILA|nr:hypothetical protein Y032_0015g2642 [Ancylostoma ceylanicum]